MSDGSPDRPEPGRPLRIGVLGAARIAPTALVKPARDVDGVEVRAVAARDPQRARAFAAKWGIGRVHADYDELLTDPDLDAVYVPAPNGLHARWTRAALEAGKHVLCEKPLTANAEQARQVAAAAERTGLVVMEAFHYRYHPLMQRAVEVVGSGELGTLTRLESWMQVPLPMRSDIRYQLDLAGGAVMDLGCYALHQLRSLATTEPQVTSAVAHESSPGVDRWMQAELRFPAPATDAGGAGGTTGATGSDAPAPVPGRMTVSLFGAVPLRIGFRVTGTDGELRVLNPAQPHLFHRFVVRTSAGTRRETFPRTPTYRYQLEAFVAAVRDGAPLLTPLSDSIANMEAIDAVYRAAGMAPRT